MPNATSTIGLRAPASPTLPPYVNKQAWSSLADDPQALAGFPGEELLKAYDHFRPAKGRRHAVTVEGAIAEGLMEAMVRIFVPIIHRHIPVGTGPRASENESARLVAKALVRGAIDDKSWRGAAEFRLEFAPRVLFAAKEAVRQQFGRGDRNKVRAAREVSIDQDEAQASPILNGIAHSQDPSRGADVRWRLDAALESVRGTDMEVLLIYAHLGYSLEELAPLFAMSAPTARKRSRALLQSFGVESHGASS